MILTTTQYCEMNININYNPVWMYVINNTYVTREEFMQRNLLQCDIVIDLEHITYALFDSTNIHFVFEGNYKTYKVTCKNCIKCKNCYDCYACINCFNCINCWHCDDCIKCYHCNNCIDCQECKQCNNSYVCRKCDNVNMCIDCRACNDCNNKIKCTHNKCNER